MAHMSSCLRVVRWALARVVVADRGGARCRSFASIVGPAVVSARIAVVSSRGGGGANEAEGAIVQMSSEEVRCSGRRE